jgi:manganese efflux pump family protein
MGYASVAIIAIGLSMDAFGVSVSKGIVLKEYNFKNSLKFALFFGFFQFLMLYVGYSISATLNIGLFGKTYIPGLLLIIFGLNMIYKTNKKSYTKDNKDFFSVKNLLALSITTSMDAMAVGLTLAMVDTNINILRTSVIVGLTSFVFSTIGIRIGKTIGGVVSDKAEYLGGFILIFIGISIIV